MKVENSHQYIICRAGGVTFIEITLVICLVAFLAGVTYRVFDRQVEQTNSDDKASKHYMNLGVFVETLNNDLAMARAVQPASNALSLLVNTDGTPGTITYTLKGNTIERIFRGAARTFEFTNPNRKDTPLIFRVEEIQP